MVIEDARCECVASILVLFRYGESFLPLAEMSWKRKKKVKMIRPTCFLIITFRVSFAFTLGTFASSLSAAGFLRLWILTLGDFYKWGRLLKIIISYSARVSGDIDLCPPSPWAHPPLIIYLWAGSRKLSPTLTHWRIGLGSLFIDGWGGGGFSDPAHRYIGITPLI